MTNISIREGIQFGTGADVALLCDTYIPEGASNAPAVLLLYGGGWRMGERARMRDDAIALAERGYVAVASDYRLNPKHRWPAHIHDAKAAIRWMRANAAELHIDPNRIALEGHSAGAHLSLLAAGTPNLPEFEGDGGNPGVSTEVAAVAAIYPPVRFHIGAERPSGSTAASALIIEGATAELARAASPIEYVSASFPPTFLLHGSADKVVPPSASLRMYEALSAAGAPVELKMYANLPHGFARIPSLASLVHDEIANFLDRHVGSPASLAAELDELQSQMALARAAAL
ncbi:MAG TPA: alpha/beta hydrolase [Tepidiformaceae bacterium]|nr:alpha/beta hydrolase [Tepidiformaceae bacterium]